MSLNPLIPSVITVGQNIYLSSVSVSTGALVVTGGVGISNDTNIGGNLTISGNTSILGNLSVSGNTFIFGNLFCGNTQINGNLSIIGNVSLVGNLIASKTVTNNNSSIIIRNGTMYINNPSNVSTSSTTGVLVVNGSTSISSNGTTNIGGIVTFSNGTTNTGGQTNGTLVVSTGGVYIAGTTSVAGQLWVGTGASAFQVVNSSGGTVSLSAANTWTATNRINYPIFTSATNVGFGQNVFGTSGVYNGSNNTVIGSSAGYSIGASATDNTLVGYQSGYSITSGCYNTFVGCQAGYSTTTGQYNTLFGYQSGYTLTSGNYNTCLGDQAGFTLNGTHKNTFIGYQAGYFTNTGGDSNNTFVGAQSGYNNTSGTYNTCYGYQSGYNLTSGSYNVILGTKSGYNVNSGSYNVVIGYNSGYNLNTGNNNVIIGDNSGYSSTGDCKLVLVGHASGYSTNATNPSIVLTGYYNDGNGNSSHPPYTAQYDGPSTTISDSYNTFVGYNSGYYITPVSLIYPYINNDYYYKATYYLGLNNTFFGYSAGYTSAYGSDNTVFGYNAGYNLTNFLDLNTGANNENYVAEYYWGIARIPSGSNYYNGYTSANILVGYKAGYTLTSGYFNTIIGSNTGSNNMTTQTNSVLIGYNVNSGSTQGYTNSSVFIGSNAGVGSTGDYNTFVGYKSGYDNAGTCSANNCTYIGSNSGFHSQSNTAYNYSTCIGYNSTAISNNAVVLGTNAEYVVIPYNTAGTGFYMYYDALFRGSANATTITVSSDYRIKENIVPLDSSYTTDQLRPVSYYNKINKKTEFGFIAHEIQAVYPYIVSGEKDAVDEDNKPAYQHVNYNNIVVLLVNKIKMLKRRIIDLEQKMVSRNSTRAN
jgi:hypothetical protein